MISNEPVQNLILPITVYGYLGIPVLVENGLDAINCADWLKGLILDGIVAGVGAVLGFVPQMLSIVYIPCIPWKAAVIWHVSHSYYGQNFPKVRSFG